MRSSLWGLEKTELFTRPLFRPGCHWQSDPWYHECFCASLWSRGNHSTLKKEKVSLVYSLGGRLLRIVILSWLSNNFLTWCNTKFIIATELGRIKYSLGQKLSKNANYQCIFSAIFWLWCGSNSPFHPINHAHDQQDWISMLSLSMWVCRLVGLTFRRKECRSWRNLNPHTHISSWATFLSSV